MYEVVDVVARLEGCPKGTKLYTTAGAIGGECELSAINEGEKYPIVVTTESGECLDFTRYGQRYFFGIPQLFPSKENRDWNTFSLKNS